MTKTELLKLQARLDVLVEVVAVLARSLPAERAVQVRAEVARAVKRRLTGVTLSAVADEAVAADVARVVGV